MDARATVLENQLLYEESVARHIAVQPALACSTWAAAAAASPPTWPASRAPASPASTSTGPDRPGPSFNAERGLQNEFVEWDQNELPLPFDDASFDGFYEIQALSLCKDVPRLFRDVFRLLKPAARFSLLDWVSLPAFDPANPEHADLMARVKPLIGAVGTPRPRASSAP